jgi:hypothetical protein
MLVLNWLIPSDILDQEPHLHLDLVFRNHWQEERDYPISARWGYATYRLLQPLYGETEGLLTYRAQIITREGEIYREWRHQLWVHLITIDATGNIAIHEDPSHSPPLKP